MKPKIIYLDLIMAINKDSLVDYKEYQSKYTIGDSAYEMMKNIPLIVNVEGTYVKLDDIPDIVHKKRQTSLAYQYMMGIKKKDPINAILKWDRR